MKVILSQDVAKLGRRYDVVDVPKGRAMNMLIPRGLASAATPANLKRITAQHEKVAADRVADETAFAAAVEKLDGEAITVMVEANDKGHLFEALKEGWIAEALSQKGIEVAASQVIIAEPIKALGDHEVSLSNGAAMISLKLTVVAK